MISFQEKSNTQYKWVSSLIGKAWIPDVTKGFTPSPLTVPVDGKQGEYELSGVYPLIINGDYARITFGPNKKHDAAKNNNSHWMFLEVREDKVDEYNKELAKIGQSFEPVKEDSK